MVGVMTRQPYPSDVSDAEWEIILPLLPTEPVRGRPWMYDTRELYNAMRYLARTGCAWRLLPHDFPKWRTVYNRFEAWRDSGVLERINDELVRKLRVRAGKTEDPKVAIMDSQSAKKADQAGEGGRDGGKKTNGRKRFVAVDSLGLVLAIVICSAAVSESAGGVMLLEALRKKPCWTPRLEKILADEGFRGKPAEWCAAAGVPMEIGKRPPDEKGFVPIPLRWRVERTFAWFGKHRRLGRDYEVRTDSSAAMIHLSMITLMAKRLAAVA